MHTGRNKKRLLIWIFLIMVVAGILFGLLQQSAPDSWYLGEECIIDTHGEVYAESVDYLNEQFPNHLPSDFHGLLDIQKTEPNGAQKRHQTKYYDPRSHYQIPPWSNQLTPEINDVRRLFTCLFPPMRIHNRQIEAYYGSRLPHCNGVQSAIGGIEDSLQMQLVDIADSVGELVLKEADKTETFWGSGFVIAPGLFATSCHTLDSLIVNKDGRPTINIPVSAELVIRFNDDEDFSIDIESLVCSSMPGVDMALLSFCDVCSPKTPVPTEIISPTELVHQKRFMAIIGYADLNHQIDSDTADIYEAINNNGAPILKIFVPDVSLALNKCAASEGVIMDLADTTIGESGGVVIELGKLSDDNIKEDGKLGPKDPSQQLKPMVIGMHTCCSAFFDQEKGKAPFLDTPCGRLHRTADNQAVSLWSVFNDPVLCTEIKKANLKANRTISCGR